MSVVTLLMMTVKNKSMMSFANTHQARPGYFRTLHQNTQLQLLQTEIICANIVQTSGMLKKVAQVVSLL